MVYDRTKIIENFRGLIGFAPSMDASNFAARIDDSLKESASGEYINQIHNWFSAEVFSSISSITKDIVVQPWSASKQYRKYDVVSSNADTWVAIDESTNEIPTANPDSWQKTTLLSQWIWSKYDAAVWALISSLQEENKLSAHGKELRGATPVYEGNGVASNLIPKSGRFVGYQIDPFESGVSVTIQRIGMQLDRNATVPIHIVYNGVDQVVNIAFTGNGRQLNSQNITPVTIFPGMGGAVIGYYEDDLGDASAIGYDMSAISHSSDYNCCGGNSSNGFRSVWGKWTNVTAISEKDGEVTPDLTTNFGLNLAMSFKCDLSDVIILEKMSLVNALKKQLKVIFMEALAANTRNNKEADYVSREAYLMLYEDYKDPFNPRNELKKAIKALQFDLSSANAACIPCVDNSRMRIRHGVA